MRPLSRRTSVPPGQQDVSRLPVTLIIPALLLSGCQSLGLTTDVSQSPPAPAEPLLLADFNRPGHQTNLGTPFGAWEADPGDPTQHCTVRLVEEPRLGTAGYSLMLDYDVDSPNPAYCGFWMKLPRVELRQFTTLSFSLKGDPERRFTRRLRVELKDGTKVATLSLDGIEATWKRFRIPLRAFDGIARLRQLSEFVIVFEDREATEKVGTVYLEDVALE